MIPAVALLVVLLLAAWLVWVQPDSADYVALCLTKRARAVRAARSAYKAAWNEDCLKVHMFMDPRRFKQAINESGDAISKHAAVYLKDNQ